MSTVDLYGENRTEEVELSVEQVRVIERSPYPVYSGSMTVTPEIDPVVIPTRETLLEDDIVILGIPYQETSNLQGGYTAIIGG